LVGAGVIYSEAPIGSGNQRWRFPQRNRILAALADVVVVVESHLGGGSIHTVDAALERATPVGAVPGSVRSPASAGTNQLLAEGAFPVRDVTDVLVALNLATREARPTRKRAVPASPTSLATAPGTDTPAPPGHRPGRVAGTDRATTAVLAALEWEPVALEHLVVRSGCSVAEVAVALQELAARGLAVEADGWWTRR